MKPYAATRHSNIAELLTWFRLVPQVPNGELNTKQLRFLGDAIMPFGDAGCGDI